MKSLGILSLISLLLSSQLWASSELPAVFCESRDPEHAHNVTLSIDSSGNVTFTRPASAPKNYTASKYEDVGNQSFNFSGEPTFILHIDHKLWDYVTKDIQGYDSKFIYLNEKGEETANYLLCRYLN